MVYSFRSSNVINALRKHLGNGFRPTANYMSYSGNRLSIGPPCDLDPVEWTNPMVAGAGSLDIPNTVDYVRALQGGGMGSIENEFNVATMRASARRRQLDTQLTLASQSEYLGRAKADGLRLSAYAGLIQGVDRLSYYLYGPKYAATENYFSNDTGLLEAVREINHDIAAHDQLLTQGSLRRARVALVFSHSDDIWNQINVYDNTSPTALISSAFFMERKALFFALRHAGYAVDIVGERDVAEGWLTDGGYALAFLSASHLDPSAATSLKDWVNDGGVLVSTAGGGLFDQFNQPMDILKPVYGIDSADLVADNPAIYMALFPSRTADDTLTLHAGSADEVQIPTVAFRQSIVTAQGEGTVVIGTYSDNSVGAIEHAYGKGKAFLIGASPGLAYLISGWGSHDTYTLLGGPAPYNPMRFSTALRDGIVKPVKDAGITRDVFTDGLLVSGGVITHENTTLIPLANYNVRAQKNLTVTVTGMPDGVMTVTSDRQGPLSFEQDGDRVTIALTTIDIVDMLSISLDKAPIGGAGGAGGEAGAGGNPGTAQGGQGGVGVSPQAPISDAGCACSVGGRSSNQAGAASLLFFLLLWRRRRSRHALQLGV
jgi:MYXO-CTERM domain-containing protein